METMIRISPEDALKIVLAKARPKELCETVPVAGALGRVCAERISAPIDNPPFDRSPFDGYAVRSADVAGATEASPVRLRLAGSIYAGDAYTGELEKGTALRIMTGAMFPHGSDSMVMQENVKTGDGGAEIFVSSPVGAYENYVRAGEDIRKGQLLIEKDETLGFAHLAVLAAMGFESITVKSLPVIGLFCTGDELVSAGSPLPAGKIYNSNEILIGSRLRELGFAPEILPVGGDDAGATAAKIDTVIEKFDAFITTGAVSVGEKDIFHEVFNILGVEKLFWRLNSKPGGAILCGIYRGKPLLCLSGNPFAALTGFELLVKPVLGKIASRSGLTVTRRRVRLSEGLNAKPMRRFMRARVEDGEAHFPAEHLSGQIFSVIGCNALLDIPADTAFEAGGEVYALPF
ncbi:MAG: molybdopterin molybdotransferase MoeA [Spirochaetaceae bacterium]|jgi:molybdopterin molybdotransferase|nr:molybdopterin molybdotransferase MoeA [Spirochaetaceae bacterium]